MVKNYDQAVTDLMAAIRRNTRGSKCIDTFESLLKEVNDQEYPHAVIADMNRFIEHMRIMFKQLDKMDNNTLKAQMLTYNFIQPERFFKKTAAYMENASIVNYTINTGLLSNDPAKGAKLYRFDSKNRLGHVSHHGVMTNIEENITDEDMHDIQEGIRKAALIWNYCPAIVKAIIQTKRRELNLDANSKRFK